MKLKTSTTSQNEEIYIAESTVSGNLNRLCGNLSVQITVVLLLLYLLLPSDLTSDNYLCETANVRQCLDSSWALSINWALQKNLVFGKDYVFNYGALGFLATRADLGLHRFYFLIFDSFVLANFAYIIIYAFRRHRNFLVIPVSLLTVLTVSTTSRYSENIVFILLLISIFWLNVSVERKNVRALILPAIFTALLFFIKVNIGFVGIIIFYCYLLRFIFIERKKAFGVISLAFVLPLLIFLLSFPLRTDLYGYIAGGFNLIDGYNDAMNHKLGYNFQYAVIAVILICVFLFVLFYKNFRDNIILFISYGVFSFVLFKQSFVRSDAHILIFYALFPALTALTLIFYKKVSSFQLWTFAATCACCLAIGLAHGVYSNPADRLNYVKTVFAAPDSQNIETAFNRFLFPSNVREIIGQKTVDIIPWNINYLYFNRLDYNPRPVIQSYTVYTPYLINLNKRKYESDSAPDFVVFSNETIDNRYAAFDDQAAKLVLAKNYACRASFVSQGSDFLLLEKIGGDGAIELSSPIEKVVKFNEEYFLADTGKTYFLKADINYSAVGKIARFLYKPFQLEIAFTLEDGTTRRHRLVNSTLKDGVFINPYIENEADYCDFVERRRLPENKRIKSFKIVLESPSAFVQNIAAKTFDAPLRLSVSEMSIEKNQLK